jgi:tetratricopeptide (TPR) repeat protein
MRTIHRQCCFNWVFLPFLLVSVTFSKAQDVALGLADRLLENGNNESAVTEYMRFIYFNPNQEEVSTAYYRIAMAYRNQKKWTDAIEALKKSIAVTSSDSTRDERKISMAVIMIATANYSSAEFELLQVAYYSNFPCLKKKAFLFLGICYVYTNNWEESQKTFQEYFSDTQSLQRMKIDSLFFFSTKRHYKSPALAKWFSTFVPGAGQLYSGDIKNGINAMLVNALTTYLLVHSIFQKQYQDVLISYLTLFERYYQGNRYNAEKDAVFYNEKIRMEFRKSLLDYLSGTLTDEIKTANK